MMVGRVTAQDIRCSHQGCHHAMARVVVHDGQPALEIVSRHHGERHRVVVLVEELHALLAAATPGGHELR